MVVRDVYEADMDSLRTEKEAWLVARRRRMARAQRLHRRGLDQATTTVTETNTASFKTSTSTTSASTTQTVTTTVVVTSYSTVSTTTTVLLGTTIMPQFTITAVSLLLSNIKSNANSVASRLQLQL